MQVSIETKDFSRAPLAERSRGVGICLLLIFAAADLVRTFDKLGLFKYPLKAVNRFYSTQMANKISIDIVSDTVLTSPYSKLDIDDRCVPGVSSASAVSRKRLQRTVPPTQTHNSTSPGIPSTLIPLSRPPKINVLDMNESLGKRGSKP